MAKVDLREELRRELKRHTRVIHQKLFEDTAQYGKLAEGLPEFLPFLGTEYAAAIWIMDWDHRLPSKELVLRLFAYYTTQAKEAGLRALEERQAGIAAKDLFPEFDVPDFEGLPADEAYETEVPQEGEVRKFRLVSEWRREVDPKFGKVAEEVARESAGFRELLSQMHTRPPGLGDVEAAEWVSPSESGHSRWGVDVWCLRSFNGMVGEGTAFLVDLEDKRVISQRDFQFRSG